MAKLNIKTLRAWTIGKSNLVVDQDSHVNILTFTAETCEKLQRKLAIADKSLKEGTMAKTASGITPGTFNGKGAPWPESK
jgi:hypothetical protein